MGKIKIILTGKDGEYSFGRGPGIKPINFSLTHLPDDEKSYDEAFPLKRCY